MSNQHDTMKQLMETIDKGGQQKELIETVLTEGPDEIHDATQELLAIGHEIESLVYQAGEILGDLAAENPEASMILKRAEAYWMSHIRGALALESQSTSMTSMSETIEELEELAGMSAADADDETDRIGDRNELSSRGIQNYLGGNE